MVVAIIGVLATVVLASLGSARNKSKDAKIKSILSQMRSQAELQNNGTYNDVCDPDSKSGKMYREAFLNAGVSSQNSICRDGNTTYGSASSPGMVYSDTPAATSTEFSDRWAAEIKLNSDGWLCVDYTGNATINVNRVNLDSDNICG